MSLDHLKVFGLYASQGVPFGFQSKVLPMLMRHWQKPYKSMALFQLSFLPWAARPLIATFMESSGEVLIQRSLVILGVILMFTSIAILNENMQALLLLLWLSNACTVFHDILVDKMSILLRKTSQMDAVNVYQVVGYKCGSLFSGTVLLLASSHVLGDNKHAFSISPFVGAIYVLMLAVLLRSENVGTQAPKNMRTDEVDLVQNINLNVSSVFEKIFAHMRANISLYVLLLIYKSGETIGDVLFSSFLHSRGFRIKQIASFGLFNDLVSILGSLVMVIPKDNKTDSRSSDRRRLLFALASNVLPQCLRAIIVNNERAQNVAIIMAVSFIEHFIGGAVTVAMFNFMFSNVLSSIEGTHYSVFAGLETLGKILTGSAAHLFADAFGFPVAFNCAAIVSLLPVLVCLLGGAASQGGSGDSGKEKSKFKF